MAQHINIRELRNKLDLDFYNYISFLAWLTSLVWPCSTWNTSAKLQLLLLSVRNCLARLSWWEKEGLPSAQPATGLRRSDSKSSTAIQNGLEEFRQSLTDL